ncbi:biliverdin-producing heme oxygenase [Flavobacterium foetidum]|uniref:biliverdin-producing heme oxygenase n=1 Tax=Flavobacterium foetidum TaxID=2026681 RepID=UPI001075523C|nr:biliverdin-producing heme oxygenase [Flavobacterium foetidum]KAF2508090.1 biliverdin-producing heme oxygenase [Flavobacterium foetidum]
MSTDLTSSISSSFLSDLKTQTADSHKKLENLPVSSSILSPDMNIEDYTHYLSLMLDVHKSTEEYVFPLLTDVIEDLDQRKKKHLIEDDLSFLNYTKTDFTNVFNNINVSIPFALGIFYVIEGSTLGGRFILKNVTKNPMLSGERGVRYFSGYGDKTGSFWKSFLAMLEAYEEKHNCGSDIVEGAVYAFDSIYKHFQTR